MDLSGQTFFLKNQDGDYQTAGVWVGIVILIAFGIVVLMNLAFGKGMKHTKQW